MKSLKLFFVVALFLAVVACINGQFLNTVRGSGNIITKERNTSYFSGLTVSSGIDVNLKQGITESIVVEADENLQRQAMSAILKHMI